MRVDRNRLSDAVKVPRTNIPTNSAQFQIGCEAYTTKPFRLFFTLRSEKLNKIAVQPLSMGDIQTMRRIIVHD